MRLVAIVFVLSVLLAGCGGGDDQAQITKLIGELREAQDAGDAARACTEVYVVREKGRAEQEGEQEGDEGCRQAFEQAAAARDVRGLRTKVLRVDVAGDEGTALVRTTATRPDGSELDRDVPYDVVRTEEGWRVRISGEG